MTYRRAVQAVLLDGSPASPSRVDVLLRAIAERLDAHGCQSKILELHVLQLPVNDPTYHANPEDHPNPTVRHLVKEIADADIVVLGTPLYHGAYSGLLKMTLDHLDDNAFASKVVGLVSNATSPRKSLQAAHELTIIARTMKGEVSNCLVGTCKADYGVKDGVFQIVELEIIERVKTLAEDLSTRARTISTR